MRLDRNSDHGLLLAFLLDVTTVMYGWLHCLIQELAEGLLSWFTNRVTYERLYVFHSTDLVNSQTGGHLTANEPGRSSLCEQGSQPLNTPKLGIKAAFN
jgi:hypothetical protein